MRCVNCVQQLCSAELTKFHHNCVSKDVEVNIVRFIKKAFQNLKQNQLFQFDSLERMLNVDLQRMLNARGYVVLSTKMQMLNVDLQRMLNAMLNAKQKAMFM